MAEEKPSEVFIDQSKSLSGSEQIDQNVTKSDSENTITDAHRDYLIHRHGTSDLDPMPSSDPADPLNWPAWKKDINLVLVAFHAMMTTFTAAGIIPAFQDIAADLGVGLQRASYLTSIQIVILGFSPLFWKPVSNAYGRRPVFLLSTICSAICNIGCAESKSYGAMVCMLHS